MAKILKGENLFDLVAAKADVNDLYILDELILTLEENLKTCVGMASNMIGYNKRIIVFVDENEKIDYMINPVIIKAIDEYETEEACLSLDGKRKTKRFKKIKVEYYNRKFQKRMKNYEGFTAEIIQHEIDHLDGIVI